MNIRRIFELRCFRMDHASVKSFSSLYNRQMSVIAASLVTLCFAPLLWALPQSEVQSEVSYEFRVPKNYQVDYGYYERLADLLKPSHPGAGVKDLNIPDQLIGTKSDSGGFSLRAYLRKILTSYHRVSDSGHDVSDVPCETKESNCFARVALSYEQARRFMFGHPDFHLVEDQHKIYGIRDVYCQRFYTDRDVKRGEDGFGPNSIPFHTSVNTEHVWPQSRFCPLGRKSTCENKKPHSDLFPLQKTDLHHLLPTDNRLNERRGNRFYGEVGSEQLENLACPGDEMENLTAEYLPKDLALGKVKSVSGFEGRTDTVFQPPAEVRGDIARALFYFAVYYGQSIDDLEEHFLRKWHTEDPVSADEQRRNEATYMVQKTRNPFIDFPSLPMLIDNF